jgi:hypothetical protein
MRIETWEDACYLAENIHEVAWPDHSPLEKQQRKTRRFFGLFPAKKLRSPRLVFGFTESGPGLGWATTVVYVYPDGTWETTTIDSGDVPEAEEIGDPAAFLWENREAMNRTLKRIEETRF